MAIIMFVNLKGGVAKTTNAVAIAECLASSGLRTLLIDADHQCTAGELLLGENRLLRAERSKSTLHDLLAAMLDDEFHPEQIDGHIEKNGSDIAGGLAKLSVLPCSVRIDDFQSNMAKARRGFHSTEEFLAMLRRRRAQLRKRLRDNYDFTLIDCPPSVALQVRFLLSVADSLIVPSVPDRLSVRGTLFLMDRLRKYGSKIRELGMLWSLYRVQNPVHRAFVERGDRRAHPFDRLPRPFKTIIPNAAAIAEAAETDRFPKTFKAKYTPTFAQSYQHLCQEIVRLTQFKPVESSNTKSVVG